MPKALVRVHLLIAGEVQGVGFRWAAQSVAEDLGLTGWVRNRPDGRVEAVAEGEEPAVYQFVAWCRDGPPGARVSDIDCTEGTPGGKFSDFRIERWTS